MPPTDIRPRVIALVADLDTTRPDGPERLHHLDGREFTDAEYDLFANVTPDEITLAAAYKAPSVPDGLSERHSAAKALVGLFMKYATRALDDSLDAVLDLMTDEDYAQFEYLSARHRALSARDEDTPATR
ncbi:hypothetical protein ABZ953_08120 [Streptomyces sp. NPDC046465]|uniref:hypothetical protein n=1 Tax=Streptomyces sp. NPDC046465 TaxID=3155810 RepID=UPI0033F1E10D